MVLPATGHIVRHRCSPRLSRTDHARELNLAVLVETTAGR